MVGMNSTSRKIFRSLNSVVLLTFAVLCVLPIWHVIMASISDPLYVMSQSGIILFPKGANTYGYQMIFRNKQILHSYGNTFIYVFSATFIGMVITVMGAYALSRKNFLWSPPIMLGLTFTMLFSGGIIPTYLVVKELGLYNTRWAVILPMCVNTFNLIIIRTAMANIPPSLVESAELDGAGHMTILWKIILPLIKPTIATVTLYYAVFHWNSWFNASIYLRNRADYPLQLVLKEILVGNDLTSVTSISSDQAASSQELSRELIKYCTIVVSTLPVFVFYPFVQKYFESGVMIGAIKG